MAVTCNPAALEQLAKCFNCTTQKQNLAIKTYLLSQIGAQLVPGIATTPGALMAAADCFTCLTEKQLLAVQIYLLCAIANASGA